jgi:hypothetical protein
VELYGWEAFGKTMRDGGPSLQTDRAGQASTIGVVLILGITLVGTGLVVGFGSQALEDTERATTLSKSEHSMTQLDSQAAIVALGESSAQRVDLGSSGGGTFSANNDAGWIRVVHRNATGDGTNETLYNASLGAVTYENDDTTVAYQGGGVWRSTGNGSTMLSQPEFNYRGSTLTLPVIRVANNDSRTGETTALVRPANDSRQVFPNSSETYDDGSVFENPVTEGSVAVTVNSEFYQGWASFFSSRTTGNVTVNHTANQATVELITLGTVGDFEFADAIDNDGVSARGQADGHSLTDFEMTVQAEDQGNGFNNHYISFYAEEGNHRFEYVVHIPSGVNCNNGVDASDELEASVFYRNTDTGDQHEWYNNSVPATAGPIWLECLSDGSALHVEMTSDQPFTYGDTSAGETYFDWSGSPVSDADFNHADDGEPTTFNAGDETDSNHLSRHYIALLGNDFTLNARSATGGQGQGAQINYDKSQGTLDYESGGSTYITYLHITENEIDVELE